MNEVLLTVDQVAERLHMSRPVIYDLLRSGELESITIGKSRRIPASVVDAYIEGKRQAQRETLAS